MTIINLHTHFKLSGEQTGLVDHSVLAEFRPEPDQIYSVGLHPWFLQEEQNGSWLSQVEKLATHPQVLAIGECGLDRSIEIPVEKQLPVFCRQIEIAEKMQKPLILHAVRSYSDLLQIKKSRIVSVPWILHGYHGNADTTRQLIGQGYFFSFGAALLKDQEKLNQSLRLVPADHLFFETDEMLVPVESIYNFASSVLGMHPTKLKETVYQNFQRIFKGWQTGRNEQP